MKITTIFSKIACILSVLYVFWFIYERYTCVSCWGNDIFFSIPFMAIVPASFENVVVIKYIVVFANAVLIWSVVQAIGTLFSALIRLIKK